MRWGGRAAGPGSRHAMGRAGEGGLGCSPTRLLLLLPLLFPQLPLWVPPRSLGVIFLLPRVSGPGAPREGFPRGSRSCSATAPLAPGWAEPASPPEEGPAEGHPRLVRSPSASQRGWRRAEPRRSLPQPGRSPSPQGPGGGARSPRCHGTLRRARCRAPTQGTVPAAPGAGHTRFGGEREDEQDSGGLCAWTQELGPQNSLWSCRGARGVLAHLENFPSAGCSAKVSPHIAGNWPE